MNLKTAVDRAKAQSSQRNTKTGDRKVRHHHVESVFKLDYSISLSVLCEL